MLTGKQQGIVLKTLIISSDFDHPLFSLSINLKFVQVQLKIIFLCVFFLSYLQFYYVKMFLLSEEVEEKLTFFVLYSTSILFMDVYFHCKKTSNDLDLVCQLHASLNAFAQVLKDLFCSTWAVVDIISN